MLKIYNFIKNKFEYFWLSFLIFFGTYISLKFFIKESIRLDESQTIWQVARPLDQILGIVASDVHLPLYDILVYFWRQRFGIEIMDMRILSLIFFLLGILAIFLLTKLITGSKQIALFTATVFTISPYMNWYANELRMYSLLVLVSILSHYCFLRIYLHTKTIKLNWVLYFLISLIGIFTHYFYFLLILSQIIFFISFRKNFDKNNWKYFTGMYAGLFVCFLPWVRLVLSLGKAGNQSPALIKPSTVDFFNIYSQHIFGFQSDLINSIILSSWPMLGLFALLFLQKNPKLKGKYIYLIFVTFIPVLISFLISYSFRPIFLSRYLSVTVPSLFIVISGLIYSYRDNVSVFLRIGLLSMMSLGLFFQVVSFKIPVKENYRQLISHVINVAQKNDIVAISAPFTIYPFDYYYNGRNKLETIPFWDRSKGLPAFDKVAMTEQLNGYKSKYGKMYLVLSYDQGYEKDIKQFCDENFVLEETIEFSQKLNLYVYKLNW